MSFLLRESMSMQTDRPRESHRTRPGKPGEDRINALTAGWLAGGTATIRSGCERGIRVRRLDSAAQVEERAARPCLHRSDRPSQTGGDLRLAQPAVIGEQDHALFDRGQ